MKNAKTSRKKNGRSWLHLKQKINFAKAKKCNFCAFHILQKNYLLEKFLKKL